MPRVTVKKPKKLDKFKINISQRIFAYKLLSRVFLEEPNKDLVFLFTSNGFLSSFPYIKDKEEIRDGVDLVNQSISGIKDDSEIMNLKTDYTQLFIGPEKLPSPPWESVYRGEKRLVFGEHTIQVRRAYQSYGFTPERLNQDPDDHIGYELDFMYRLNEKIINKIKQGDIPSIKKLLISQKDFLADHLSKWTYDFTADVEKNARSDFFRGFAKVLSGFIKQDRHEINSLLRQLRGGSAAKDKKINIQSKKVD